MPGPADDAIIEDGAPALIGGAVPATFRTLLLGSVAGATVNTLRVAGTISTSGSLTIRRNAVLRLETAQASTLGQVAVADGGAITHLANSAARAYIVNLNVTGGFDLQPGAMIDAAGKGYAGGTSTNGSGPGAGRGATGYCGSTGGGAGHGGSGGAASTYNLSPGGGSYDSMLDPSDLGSGGGVSGDPSCGGGPSGGSGGGAVILNVGNTVTLDGTVSVDGANGGVGAGGGSGGTINIKAGSLAGSGLLRANGGSSGGGGGGGAGGGLIALTASVGGGFNGAITAVSGTGGINGGTGVYALKIAPATGFDATVDGRGVVPSTYTTIPFNLSGLNNLTVSTASVFSTTFTVLNDLVLGPRAVLTFKRLTVAHDLVASSQAAATLSGVVVVQHDAVLHGGSVLTASSMSVTNNLTMRPGAQLKHQANAGVKQSWLSLTIGNDFDLQAGATVNLVGVGYAGGTSANGSGPGFGRGATGYCGSTGGGAGHGGPGGRSATYNLSAGGITYGSALEPSDLGSGGGAAGDPGCGGGPGGGGGGGALIMAVANTATLNGLITADGAAGGVGAGGGSGGTINLRAGSFAGSGSAHASGGTSGGSGGGGGGGGRMALAGCGVAQVGFAVAGASPPGGGVAGGAGSIRRATWPSCPEPPLTPVNLVVASTGSTPSGGASLTAAWNADWAATSYTFQLALDPAFTIGVISLTTSAASLTVSDLLFRTAYYLRLRSSNDFGDSAYSETLAVSVIPSIVDDASDLIVPAGSTYTLSGSRSYSNSVFVDGTLLVAPLTGSASGFLELSAPQVRIGANGVLSADGAGFPSGQGAGAGAAGGGNQFNNYGGGGGGHGGFGGYARIPVGGPGYGSLTQPLDFGSGGGAAGGAGGAGGGRIRISAGTLQLDGRISAEGRNGVQSSPEATYKIPSGGGGSGGSVLISASNLLGSGTIAANGGDSPAQYGAGGGGGGGRISVTYGSTAFTGSILSRGGGGYQAGGAGTVVYGSELRVESGVQGAITAIPAGSYSFDSIRFATGAVVELTSNASLTAATLFVEGPSLFKLFTGSLSVPRIELLPSSGFRYDGGNLTVADVIVDSGAVLTVDARLKAAQLLVRSGGLVTHAARNAAFELAITNTLTIEAGARISANGMGFPAAQGPGAGYAITTGSPFDSGGGGGGGGYGGLGGRSDNFHSFSGAVYGSLVQPLELGSGGGGIGTGGSGGGRLKISAGVLQLDGSISADGATSAPGSFTTGGGGSGGAILLTASNILGGGGISVRGGNSYAPVDRLAGGGGGGRIALFYGARSGAWSAVAVGGTGKVSGQPGTIMDNGQVTGLDPASSSGTLAASQMTQRLESSKDLSETISAQLTDFSGMIATGTAPGTFTQADIRLVLVKTGPFAEKGFFRGHWTLNLSALATMTGEWEGMAYLAPDEPRRLILKGSLKGQVRGVINGTLSESAPGSGVFDRLSAACRIVQVDAAAGAGDMFINGSGVPRESAQYPGTALKLLQTSLTGQTAGYYSSPLDVTFTFLRVDNPGNPYQGEGFFVASYNSTAGPGSGWAYAVAYDQVARLGGYLDSSLRGLMEGVLTLNSPRSLLLTLQNLDVGLPFLAELMTDFSGPSNGNSGSKVTFSVTLRNEGYSAADGVSLVAVYPLGTDFTSASGSYKVYNVVNTAQSFEFPQPFIRWDFPRVEPRSSVQVSYQAFVRLPGPGMPASGSKLGGDLQVITTDWADKVFAGYEDKGAP